MNPSQSSIEQQIDALQRQVRGDVEHVHDAGFRALLETTAQVLAALKTAYRHQAERLGEPPVAGREIPDDIAAAHRREQYQRTHLSPH